MWLAVLQTRKGKSLFVDVRQLTTHEVGGGEGGVETSHGQWSLRD